MEASFVMRTEPAMPVVCSWCKRLLNQRTKEWERVDEVPTSGVTHSICSECKVDVEAQIQRHYGHLPNSAKNQEK